jgi:hypothetical protein
MISITTAPPAGAGRRSRQEAEPGRARRRGWARTRSARHAQLRGRAARRVRSHAVRAATRLSLAGAPLGDRHPRTGAPSRGAQIDSWLYARRANPHTGLRRCSPAQALLRGVRVGMRHAVCAGDRPFLRLGTRRASQVRASGTGFPAQTRAGRPERRASTDASGGHGLPGRTAATRTTGRPRLPSSSPPLRLRGQLEPTRSAHPPSPGRGSFRVDAVRPRPGAPLPRRRLLPLPRDPARDWLPSLARARNGFGPRAGEWRARVRFPLRARPGPGCGPAGVSCPAPSVRPSRGSVAQPRPPPPPSMRPTRPTGSARQRRESNPRRPGPVPAARPSDTT